MRTNLFLLFKNEITATSVVGLTTETVPNLGGGKSNPHQGRIIKYTPNMSVMVFHTIDVYENIVKNRLRKEGKDPDSFEVGTLPWAYRIPNTPFLKHLKKDAYYLEVIVLYPGTPIYYLDGREIDADKVIGLKGDPTPRQGGLDNKVIVRVFDVNNIKAIKVHGKVYDQLFFDIP